MKSSSLLPRIFLVSVIANAECLAIGVRWNWLFGVGVRGLVLDFLFGILVLGQYLHENGKL